MVPTYYHAPDFAEGSDPTLDGEAIILVRYFVRLKIVHPSGSIRLGRLWAASEPDILRRPQAYSRYRELCIPLASGGHSVTSHVDVEIKMYPQRFGLSMMRDPLDRQKPLCDLAALGMSPNLSLFPADDVPQSAHVGMDQTEMVDAAPSFGPNAPYPPVEPFVVSCIDYQFGGALRHHQTKFAYRLVGPTPEHSNVTPLFNLNNLPPGVKSIVLVKLRTGNEAE